MGILNLKWLRTFGALHERARRGELQGRELTAYREEREDLERALLAAQHLALETGQKPRRALRVAHALEVEIEMPEGSQRARTLNLSRGGFAALLQAPPELGQEIAVTLAIPGGGLRSLARVAHVRPRRAAGDPVRIGFEFVALSGEDAERLGMLVFDIVLEQLKG
jgi:hypothetical protein